MKKKSKYSNFSHIGENISRLMEAHGIDATELAKQTDLPTSTISRLRSNLADHSPNLSSLMPIAEFFNITISQLIGENSISSEDYEINLIQNQSQKLSIPLLKTEEIISYISGNFSTSKYVAIDIPVNKESFSYLLQGNAMEPQFPDKTLLIIDQTIKPENLDYVLLLQSDKKLPIFRQILIEGNEKYFQASNPIFNELIKFSEGKDKILGVMVQSRRNFKVSDLLQAEISSTNSFYKKSKKIQAF